jgi:hypothetical protein
MLRLRGTQITENNKKSNSPGGYKATPRNLT